VKFSLENFGENLKSIREVWGYSQDEFGQILVAAWSEKSKRVSISNYERGVNDPPFEVVFALSEKSGFTLNELFGRKINKEEIRKTPLGEQEGGMSFSEPSSPEYKLRIEGKNERLLAILQRLEIVEKTQMIRAETLETLQDEIEGLRREIAKLKSEIKKP